MLAQKARKFEKNLGYHIVQQKNNFQPQIKDYSYLKFEIPENQLEPAGTICEILNPGSRVYMGQIKT